MPLEVTKKRKVRSLESNGSFLSLDFVKELGEKDVEKKKATSGPVRHPFTSGF